MQQNRRSIAHLLKHHKGVLNALTVQYALYPNAASLAALSISPDVCSYFSRYEDWVMSIVVAQDGPGRTECGSKALQHPHGEHREEAMFGRVRWY